VIGLALVLHGVTVTALKAGSATIMRPNGSTLTYRRCESPDILP